MTTVDRILFCSTLPDDFFAGLVNEAGVMGSGSGDDPAVVAQLFRMEAARNEIIVYTDHQALRLVGIFPENAAETFFGYWETAHDLALNQRAFAMLEADARQRVRTGIFGPMNFSTFHRYRLRLGDVPSWGRFDREPVNPPYYPILLDQLGFRVRSRFESRLLRKETVPVVYQDKKQLLAKLTTIPFDFIPLNPDTWLRYEDELFGLVHQIFSANPAYKPIPKAQFDLLYNRQFSEMLCPHSSVLLSDRQTGRLVAMSFCQPNYQSLALAPGDTPVFARDFARLDKKILLVKSVGVHPAYRKRGG